MTQLFNTKKSLEECRTNFKEAIGTGNIRGRIGRIRKGSILDSGHLASAIPVSGGCPWFG